MVDGKHTEAVKAQALAQEVQDFCRLPHYLDAGWRNVTPVCRQTSRIGIGFDTATGPVRLGISLEHAAELAACLDAYIKAFAGNQSCGSGLAELGRNETSEESVAWLASVAAAGQGA